MREINLSLVMRCLQAQAPISRAGVASLTGLNKTTVSSLVHELITMDLIHESGFENSVMGRPGVLLELNAAVGYFLSVEIGVHAIIAICTDFSTKIIHSETLPRPSHWSQEETLGAAIQLLKNQTAGDSYGKLLGIAIGVPGLVAVDSNHLLFAPNLAWQDIPIGSIFEQAFPNAHIVVDNEANLAGFGEYYFGAAQGYKDVLYLSLGVGLGGALIRAGQIYRGASGFAGEFGHITLVPDGYPCSCGNTGCWETLCSIPALNRFVQAALDEGQDSVLSKLTGQNGSQLSLYAVQEAANNGDIVAQSAFNKIGYFLGVGIASMLNTQNPELVVIGGPLSEADQLFLPSLTKQLQSRSLKWAYETASIVMADFRSQASVMGGVATLLDRFLSQPSKSTEHYLL